MTRKPTTIAKGRRVTFPATVSKVVQVISKDKDDVWLSQKELVEYRKDMLRSLRYAQKYGFDVDSIPASSSGNVCLRGMESLLNNGLSAGRRRLARRAVLQAQSMKDPEFVARIYKNYCNSSTETAQTNAKKDEEAVKKMTTTTMMTHHQQRQDVVTSSSANLILPEAHEVTGRAA